MSDSSQKIRVGLVQMSCREDVSVNLKSAQDRIGALAQKGAHIVCLQELFLTPYFCQREDPRLFSFAEPVPGKSVKKLQETAESHGVVIVAGLFEKRAEGIYHNTCVVIDADGRYLGKYRKLHIPDDPNYHEKFYFTPGDLGYQVFHTRYAKVGTLICWDQWYPEAARLTALKGAEIIVYPTAIGWLAEDKPALGQKQLNAWRSVQVGHAIANEVFVAVPNRVGKESNIEFWGNSFVVDPFGELLHQASQTGEEDVLVTCDLSLIGEHRQTWPFLRDRRIDTYKGLLKRFDDAS